MADNKSQASNIVVLQSPSNDAADTIVMDAPYSVAVSIFGTADILFHRWSCEGVDAKAAKTKGSAARKTDDTESYLWRDSAGDICLPGEYLRQSIIAAAKYRQDPRSPRASAIRLMTAAIVSLTPLASLGVQAPDYYDTRRVMVQRNGINRRRPALVAGWSADFVLQVLTPEYVSPAFLHDLISMAGRLIGVGDFRPTYGRFAVGRFEVLQE